MTRKIDDPNLFRAARYRLKHNNDMNTYLKMRELVGTYVGSFFMALDQGHDSKVAMERTAKQLAEELLAKKPKSVAVHFWNKKDGGLSDFVKEQINSTETDPMKIIEHAVFMMVSDLWDLLQDKDAGESFEWGRGFEATVRRYCMLFLGVPFVEQGKRQAEAQYEQRQLATK